MPKLSRVKAQVLGSLLESILDLKWQKSGPGWQPSASGLHGPPTAQGPRAKALGLGLRQELPGVGQDPSRKKKNPGFFLHW